MHFIHYGRSNKYKYKLIICSSSYNMIGLKPLKYNSTNRDKTKYSPRGVMWKYYIISFFQQLEQIFQCVNNKLSQMSVLIIPILCILKKVMQQRMIRSIQKILQEGVLLIQKNLKMTTVPLSLSVLLVEQLGIFKSLVSLTLQLPNFFELLV